MLEGSEQLAQQFLQLIFFRYVPNRTVPADLLRNEGQAIANSIFMRMKGDQHAAKLLEALGEAGGRFLAEATQSLDRADSPLSSPSLSPPESIGEMLSMTGFQAVGPHGLPVEDEDWGSGHQAFFLYEILHSLDTTNYGLFFGWRQATIWALGEPESALHRDLEVTLAEQLRRWSSESRCRLQIFQTTHSPIFTMAADAGFWVEVEKGETVVSRHSIGALAREAETKGVSGWVPPVLSFPWCRVVLVEGRSDVAVLEHTAKVANVRQFKFVCLTGLDPEERGDGRDSIIKYVRQNSSLIANRPQGSPFFVLLDWDSSDQVMLRAKEAYGELADRFVVRMNSDYCEVALGPDFKGIERFYPSRVVREAHDAEEMLVGMSGSRPYSVSKDQLGKSKRALQSRLQAIDCVEELQPLLRVLVDLETRLRQDSPLQVSIPGFE